MDSHNYLGNRMKEKCPNLFLLKCVCHSFHLCVPYAREKLPGEIEQLAREVLHVHFLYAIMFIVIVFIYFRCIISFQIALKGWINIERKRRGICKRIATQTSSSVTNEMAFPRISCQTPWPFISRTKPMKGCCKPTIF